MNRQIWRILIIIASSFLLLHLAYQFQIWRHNSEAENLPHFLYLEETGSSGPKAVLLHGLAASSRYMTPVKELPKSKFHVFIPDLLGHGRSPWPKIHYSADDHINAVNKSLRTVDEPFILIGHSLGTQLALHYAKKFPEKIKKLIILSPTTFSTFAEMRQRISRDSVVVDFLVAHPIFSYVICHLHTVTGKLLLPIFLKFGGKLPDYVLSDSMEHTWESYSGSLENVVLGESIESLLQATRPIPTLVIAGQQDIYADQEIVKSYSQLANVELHQISGGHNVLYENESPVLELISQFLGR